MGLGCTARSMMFLARLSWVAALGLDAAVCLVLGVMYQNEGLPRPAIYLLMFLFIGTILWIAVTGLIGVLVGLADVADEVS